MRTDFKTRLDARARVFFAWMSQSIDARKAAVKAGNHPKKQDYDLLKRISCSASATAGMESRASCSVFRLVPTSNRMDGVPMC